MSVSRASVLINLDMSHNIKRMIQCHEGGQPERFVNLQGCKHLVWEWERGQMLLVTSYKAVTAGDGACQGEHVLIRNRKYKPSDKVE